MLRKAMAARSPAARARWARLGLSSRAPLDKTTQAMLLRQLYLSHYEVRRFDARADGRPAGARARRPVRRAAAGRGARGPRRGRSRRGAGPPARRGASRAGLASSLPPLDARERSLSRASLRGGHRRAGARRPLGDARQAPLPRAPGPGAHRRRAARSKTCRRPSTSWPPRPAGRDTGASCWGISRTRRAPGRWRSVTSRPSSAGARAAARPWPSRSRAR